MRFTRARSPVRARPETLNGIFFLWQSWFGRKISPLILSLVLKWPSKLQFDSLDPEQKYDWLVGLGVWFSLRVREVPGSNPGRALHFFKVYFLNVFFEKVGKWPRWHVTLMHTHLLSLTSFFLLLLLSFKLFQLRSRGVMVSTLDSESSDPSSNLGGTWTFFLVRPRLPGTLFESLYATRISFSDLRAYFSPKKATTFTTIAAIAQLGER